MSAYTYSQRRLRSGARHRGCGHVVELEQISPAIGSDASPAQDGDLQDHLSKAITAEKGFTDSRGRLLRHSLRRPNGPVKGWLSVIMGTCACLLLSTYRLCRWSIAGRILRKCFRLFRELAEFHVPGSSQLPTPGRLRRQENKYEQYPRRAAARTISPHSRSLDTPRRTQG